MHMIYSIFFYWSLLNIIFFSQNQTKSGGDKEVWLINASSSLRVDGKTNINSFNCVIASYGRTDTMICDAAKGTMSSYRINSVLEIPVKSFDCHHKIMTKDLQKTLKAEQYPMMFIDFKSLTRLPKDAIGAECTGEVLISLAGTQKKYVIQFQGKNYLNQIEFVGNKTILFSDFGLKPPSKLGGSIRVKDQLDVEVRLHLKKAS